MRYRLTNAHSVAQQFDPFAGVSFNGYPRPAKSVLCRGPPRWMDVVLYFYCHDHDDFLRCSITRSTSSALFASPLRFFGPLFRLAFPSRASPSSPSLPHVESLTLLSSKSSSSSNRLVPKPISMSSSSRLEASSNLLRRSWRAFSLSCSSSSPE